MYKSRFFYFTSLIFCICVALSSFGCTYFGFENATTADTCSSDNSFDELTDDFFYSQLHSDTISLHYTLSNPDSFGIDDYVVSLGSVLCSEHKLKSNSSKVLGSTDECSNDSHGNCDNYYNSYLSRLKQINRKQLSKQKQIDYDVFGDYLTTQSKLSEFMYFNDYLSASNGVQAELPILLADYDFNSKQDISDYLALLKDFPRFFDDILVFEQNKADAGLFMSDELCNEVIRQCEEFIRNPESNILIQSFNLRIDEFCCTEISINPDEYKALNQGYVNDYVIPAYKKLIEGLTSLLGSATNQLGLCYNTNGRDYYEQLVYFTTGCGDSINEIFKNISKHRERQLVLCSNLLKEDNSIADKCSDICSSSMSELDSADKMLEHLQDTIQGDFPSLNKTSYELSYVDKSLQASLAPAFYITAPVDNRNINKIYLNPADNDSFLSTFTTLAHEGFPGHLYQTVMSYDYGLKPFRSILNYGGYTEGWATYVELLSYNYAGLDENMAEFLRANHDFSLSLYASSDIGIHYYGWNFDELMDFWKDYGISDEASVRQIWNIILASPANYLKYYVGYLQLLELKSYCGLSDYDFHEAILRIGPAPFSIIAKYLSSYSVAAADKYLSCSHLCLSQLAS